MAIPDRIFAQASPRSIGGLSLFEKDKGTVSSFTVAAFASPPAVSAAATMRLQAAGFEILQSTPFTINIAGSPELFKTAFRTDLVETELALPNGGSMTHLDSPETNVLGLIRTEGTTFADVLEGVALEVPRSLLDASPVAPAASYWHLSVPDEVAACLNASILHQLGLTGKGIRVAMVDSGWFRHPFFVARGYDVAPVVVAPGATAPEADESGHGTGESANIFAVAPGCRLVPVKMSPVNSLAAFNAAVALKPDIITCSWGGDRPTALGAADMALEASVAAAVGSGITVIFSAGNGHAGFPGQHPDVISAGGVFMDEDGSLQASNYSTGFQSQIYPGRRVPDVCGLVGQRPKAIYIMLPVEPGDAIDVGNAGAGTGFPDDDETTANDGWAAFSGTSAAAPQLAGVAALIKQLVPTISPLGIKGSLAASARDVDAGFCSQVSGQHHGLPAGPGPDDATGAGLVDAFAAAVHAYFTRGVGFMGAPAQSAPEPASGDLSASYWRGYADAVAAIKAARGY